MQATAGTIAKAAEAANEVANLEHAPIQARSGFPGEAGDEESQTRESQRHGHWLSVFAGDAFEGPLHAPWRLFKAWKLSDLIFDELRNAQTHEKGGRTQRATDEESFLEDDDKRDEPVTPSLAIDGSSSLDDDDRTETRPAPSVVAASESTTMPQLHLYPEWSEIGWSVWLSLAGALFFSVITNLGTTGVAMGVLYISPPKVGLLHLGTQ